MDQLFFWIEKMGIKGAVLIGTCAAIMVVAGLAVYAILRILDDLKNDRDVRKSQVSQMTQISTDLHNLKNALQIREGVSYVIKSLETKIDERFTVLEAKFDKKFDHLESKTDARIDQLKKDMEIAYHKILKIQTIMQVKGIHAFWDDKEGHQ